MLFLAEILRTIAIVVLIFSASFYFRHLERIKKQRKQTKTELTHAIIIQTAFGLLVISLFISIVSRW
ncbi:hypothetical protein ACIQXI_05840 [Lysinibacillus sp. NPDC097195]|uniref:hypothetical protein n=1 Tax=Lysinibacillus sp. NPDC097195 TaxID=3364141 RepID=UPI003825682F